MYIPINIDIYIHIYIIQILTDVEGNIEIYSAEGNIKDQDN